MRKKLALSAGLVPIRITAEEGMRFLLLRVYNYWDFPKGLVERGENPLAAAVRELEEETTLTRLDFKWGEEYYETEPYSYGKVARYYVAEVEDTGVMLPVNEALGRAEHHEFRWVDYEAARRLLSPRVRAALDWARDLAAAPPSHQLLQRRKA